MVEDKIGIVKHFFNKISVAAIKVTDGELRIGDTIHIVGATTDFTQKVESMQMNKKPIEIARPGDEIGIKVKERVREKDIVYKVKEE